MSSFTVIQLEVVYGYNMKKKYPNVAVENGKDLNLSGMKCLVDMLYL